MTYVNMHTATRKTWPAIIAAIALFIAGAVSIGGINLFGVRAGFGFVPLLVLIMWPRLANRVISLVLVFFVGLFTDWATGGIVCQWALVFVLVWGFFRPEFRSSPFAPLSLLLVWLVACGLAILVISISGYFVFGASPDFETLFLQMLFATFMLPLFMLIRHAIAKRLTDREDWG